MARASEALSALQEQGLVALAVTAPDRDFCPPDARALVLIGPAGGSLWWNRIKAAPEWQDGAPDPVDRWSKRVLGGLAGRFGGAALFPSDGPPWPPFFRWAQDSGRIWQSPVGMLVHADQGLWVSFRGALALPFAVSCRGPRTPAKPALDSPAGPPARSAHSRPGPMTRPAVTPISTVPRAAIA